MSSTCQLPGAFQRRFGRIFLFLCGAMLCAALLSLVSVPATAAPGQQPRTSLSRYAEARAAEDDFDEVMARAEMNMRRRNYDEAVKLFKRANKMQGENCADCLWGLAQAYMKVGARKNVLETCDKLLLAAGPNHELAAKAHNLKGITYAGQAMEKDKSDQKKLAEAEAAFRKVLETDSEFAMAHYNLGVTLIRMNREADGLAELKIFVDDYDEESDTAEEARKMIENPRRARENYAPDFAITTSEGEYISSDDLRGKVVLLDFWGTWCPPCVASVPSLVRLNKRFSKDQFMLISVSSDNDAQVWSSFVAKNKMTWPQYLDRNGKVLRQFEIHSFPTYVLVDHDGVVRHRSSGWGDYMDAMIEGSVKKALKTLARSSTEPAKAAPHALATEPATATSSAPRTAPARAAVESSRAEAAPVVAQNPAGVKAGDITLPAPVIEVAAAEEMALGAQKMNRFPLRMKNWEYLPDDLFAPANDLAPCGMGPHPTRLEVSVWSEAGQRLLSYCDTPRREFFQNFWLILMPADTPERIYVTLKDRRTGAAARSNTVALPAVKSAAL